MTDPNKILDRCSSLKVLIVGDVIVDIYSWGTVNRQSPEAPVPIVDVNKKEIRLGGAANVARNIEALGATSILCGVIGNDAFGNEFVNLLEQNGINASFVHKSSTRKTTVKHRVFNEDAQVLRIDDEDDHDLSDDENQKLLTMIERAIEEVDVVILQDYDKGVLHEGNIEKIISLAHKHDKPVTVDPKIKNFSYYRKVDLFKPNLGELRDGLSILVDASDESSIHSAVSKLKEKLEVRNVLLTLAENGLYIDMNDEQYLLATKVTSVADVCGAGDAVISVASLLFALRVDPNQIGSISNIAGGLVCGDVGVTTVTREALQRSIEKQN